MAAVVLALGLLPCSARADDYGPAHDVRTLRSDAARLLAHRLRMAGLDPKTVQIFDVVVVRNAALLSWTAGNQHQIMGLLRHDDRWWDSVDMKNWPSRTPQCFPQDLTAAAAVHNADVIAAAHPRIVTGPIQVCNGDDVYNGGVHIPVRSGGGTVHADFNQSSAGYDFSMRYAPNDAASGTAFTRLYVRAPTAAEFLPFPTPGNGVGGPTDVGFFDVEIGGGKAVRFEAGSAIDIWFPFVLDDTLRYDISYFTNGTSYGPYHGTLYDNVLHFELPAFTVVPGAPLQAEISGWY